MLRVNWFFGMLLIGSLVCVGCKQPEEAIPVSGTVTLDGKPVEGATVNFSPQATTGKVAVGLTDAAGKFTLNTPELGLGAMGGIYDVTVTKSQLGAGSGEVWQDPRGMGGELTEEQKKEVMNMANRGKKPANLEDAVPAKYGNAKSSGLKANVTKGQANDFTFELKS